MQWVSTLPRGCQGSGELILTDRKPEQAWWDPRANQVCRFLGNDLCFLQLSDFIPGPEFKTEWEHIWMSFLTGVTCPPYSLLSKCGHSNWELVLAALWPKCYSEDETCWPRHPYPVQNGQRYNASPSWLAKEAALLGGKWGTLAKYDPWWQKHTDSLERHLDGRQPRNLRSRLFQHPMDHQRVR